MNNILNLYARLTPPHSDSKKIFHGGAQQKSSEVALNLNSIDGFTVFYASDDNGHSANVKFLRENGIHHYQVRFRSKAAFLYNILKLLRIVRFDNIQAIQANDRLSAMYGRVVSWCTGVKYVYVARNDFRNIFFTRVFFGHNIIAISEGVKENLQTFFKIPGNRIDVIHNGTDITNASIDDVKILKTDLKLTDYDEIITVVGRLSKQKGHEYLFAAVEQVSKMYPLVKCLIVGSGELETSLKQLAGKLGVYGNVRFCGHQNNVAAYIQASKFVVVPSLWEGFGTNIIESMALGKTVIASDVGGIPDIVKDEFNGLLVPPQNAMKLADKILFLLENPEIVRDLSKNAYEVTAPKFSMQKMLQGYEKYYRDLLGTK